MSKIYRITFSVIFLLAFNVFINAQNDVSVAKKDRNIIVVGAGKTLEFGGKAAYVVTKETAKLAWKTTKFTAGEIAAPVAKAIVVKATPKVSLFLLKQSGNVIEKAAPIALKAAITYLKL